MQLSIPVFGADNTKVWVLMMTNLRVSSWEIIHIHMEIKNYLLSFLLCLLFSFPTFSTFCFPSSVLFAILFSFQFGFFAILFTILFPTTTRVLSNIQVQLWAKRPTPVP